MMKCLHHRTKTRPCHSNHTDQRHEKTKETEGQTQEELRGCGATEGNGRDNNTTKDNKRQKDFEGEQARD